MKNLILLLLLSLHFNLNAKTYLAFFEFYDYQGNLIQIEEGGRFSHIAINNGDFWLHAHPAKGFVEAVDSIKDMNFYKAKVYFYENENLILSSNALKEYIGVNYDRTFDWNNRALYNSELIAIILGIQPGAMSFGSPFWNGQNNLPNGKDGLSPDDIFKQLDDLGFYPANY